MITKLDLEMEKKLPEEIRIIREFFFSEQNNLQNNKNLQNFENKVRR